MSIKLNKNVYFVNAGDRTGQFLTVVDYEESKETYAILAFTESEPLYIIKKQFEDAIMGGLITFVETIPEDVHNECKKEFLYRVSNK